MRNCFATIVIGASSILVGCSGSAIDPQPVDRTITGVVDSPTLGALSYRVSTRADGSFAVAIADRLSATIVTTDGLRKLRFTQGKGSYEVGITVGGLATSATRRLAASGSELGELLLAGSTALAVAGADAEVVELTALAAGFPSTTTVDIEDPYVEQPYVCPADDVAPVDFGDGFAPQLTQPPGGKKCCDATTPDLMAEKGDVKTKAGAGGLKVGPFELQLSGPWTDGQLKKCPGVSMPAKQKDGFSSGVSKCGGVAGYSGDELQGFKYSRVWADGPSASDGTRDTTSSWGADLNLASLGRLKFGCLLAGEDCSGTGEAGRGAYSLLKGNALLCRKDDKTVLYFVGFESSAVLF